MKGFIIFVVFYCIGLIIEKNLPKKKTGLRPFTQEEIEKQNKKAEQEKRKEEREKEQAAKKEFNKQLAANDKEFLIEQIDDTYKLLWKAEERLKKAQEEVEHDNMLNQYGAVISEIKIEKHGKELSKARKEVNTYRNKIHNLERQLNKADFIIHN